MVPYNGTVANFLVNPDYIQQAFPAIRVCAARLAQFWLKGAIVKDLNIERRIATRSRRLLHKFVLSVALVLGSSIFPFESSAASDAPEKPLQKLKLVVDFYPQAELGGFYTAWAEGFYRQEGLDIDILSGGPNLSPTTRVVVGEANIGVANSGEVILARSRGLPTVAIMAAMQHIPQGFMVHAESDVNGFSDFEGHSVIVDPGASFFRFLVMKYKWKNVREIPYAKATGVFIHKADLIQQCFITSEPFYVERTGQKVRTFLISDAGLDTYQTAFTTDKFLEQNPDAAAAFVRASNRGFRRYLDDPASGDAEILRRNPQMTIEAIHYSFASVRAHHFFEGDPAKGEAIGKFDPARWEENFKIMRDIGTLGQFTEYQKSFTTRFNP